MSQGVDKLNDNKVGVLFVYSDPCFMGMALFRNTIGIAYRQLQGIAEDCLGEDNTPNFSAIYKRINKIKLEESNGKSWFADGKTKTEIVFLVGNYTGLKPTSRGDWMGSMWNIRRGFIKIYVIVDSKTKKIYAVSITDDKAGNVPEFKKLLDEVLQNIGKSSNVLQSDEMYVGTDGAYDSNDNFDECNKQDVILVILVRKNFSLKTDGRYDRRWSVEIAFSTFKRILDENISARVWCNVVKEIKFKVMVYHLMIDTAQEQEMNQN